MLLARIDHAAWLEFLSRQPAASDATALLLDQNGVVIAGTRDDVRFVGRERSPELARLIRDRAAGACQLDGLNGQPSYSAYCRSQAGGWTVATGAPAMLVEADLRRSTLALLGGGALALLLAIGIGLVAGGRVARPVRSLARLAGTLGPDAETAPGPSSRHGNELGEVERALHEAAAGIRRSDATLTRLAPAGVFRADAEGRCEYVNDRWVELIGVAAPRAAGASFIEAVHPDDRLRVRRGWGDAVATRADLVTRFRVAAPNGGARWLEARARPVPDAPASPIAYVGIVLDVSEEQRAVERQQTLLEQAHATRDEAAAASQAKDDFLGFVSHELRNPLNSTKLWLEVLRQQPAGSPLIRRALEGIEHNTATQAQLIDDLLDISRIVSGTLQMATDTVLLGPLVSAAVDVARPAGTAKGVVLDLALDPAPASVAGDPERLHRVVLNLLSNAVKVTPKGGRVAVALTRDGSTARLAITDGGEGIDPALLPHLFDRSAQGDAASRVSGPGLGFRVARQLVELQGGRIWAESAEPGRGTRFVLELPLAPASAERPAERTPGAPDTLVPLDGLRVLVVEDDPSSREGIELVLRSAGAAVTAVGSVPSALGALDQSAFDVMVSDIGMPGQDGYDLIRQLRTRPPERGGRTQSIALTAYSTLDDRRRALAAGYEVHLPKPVSPPALTRAIAELTTRAGAGEARPPS